MADPLDVSSMTDEQLLAIVRSRSPSVGDTVADVAKSGGVGVGKGLIGLAGLPGDVASLLNRGINYATEKVGLGSAPFDPNLGTSGQIQRGVEKVTGEFYKPKTTAGQYAETVGEFVPAAAAGPGGILRRVATQAVVPGLASEAAGQATKGTSIEPYARMGAALVAPGVASTVARAPATGVPAIPELRTAKNAAYTAAENAGVVVTPKSYANLSDDVFKTAAKHRLDPDLTPGSTAVVRRIQELTDPRVGPITLETVDNLRALANDAWRNAKPKTNDRTIANVIKGRIDDWADKLTAKDIIAGDPVAGVKAFQEARALNKRLRASEAVEEATSEGIRRGQRLFTGAGVEHGIRTQFENLYKREGKSMPADLRQAVGDVGSGGSFLANRIRDVGRFAPRGPVSVGLSVGLGGVSDPQTALGASALGEAGRFLATRMTKNRARVASELARRGGPDPTRLTDERIARLLALEAAAQQNR